MYNEDEFLMLSGLQHYAFCKRQWALIHLEQQWEENYRTVDGALLHERAHEGPTEARKDVISVRGMKVHSYQLGISGECDVVEFIQSDKGVSLHGRHGLWSVVPVEYKRGHDKIADVDRLQVCAQALCLEEMLGCVISQGDLYYGETHHRVPVEFDSKLRNEVMLLLKEMHDLSLRKWTPKAKKTSSCAACSLVNQCLPMVASRSATSYFEKRLEDCEK